MMQALWRRTTAMFWGYPVLWLPVLVADLLAFGAQHSRRPLLHLLVTPLLVRHSVLVGAIDELAIGSTNAFLGEVLAALITAFTQFSSILSYTIGFFLTAELVDRRLGRFESWERGSELKRILKLSVRAYAIAFVMGFCLFGGLTYELAVHGNHLWSSVYFTQGGGLVVMAVLAYLLAPAALRSVAKDGMIDPQAKLLARQAALLAVVASAACVVFTTAVETSMLAMPQPWVLVRIVASLIAATPYIPLFIALALLAFERPHEMSTGAGIFGDPESGSDE
jgi:hypothetical protein